MDKMSWQLFRFTGNTFEPIAHKNLAGDIRQYVNQLVNAFNVQRRQVLLAEKIMLDALQGIENKDPENVTAQLKNALQGQLNIKDEAAVETLITGFLLTDPNRYDTGCSYCEVTTQVVNQVTVEQADQNTTQEKQDLLNYLVLGHDFSQEVFQLSAIVTVIHSLFQDTNDLRWLALGRHYAQILDVIVRAQEEENATNPHATGNSIQLVAETQEAMDTFLSVGSQDASIQFDLFNLVFYQLDLSQHDLSLPQQISFLLNQSQGQISKIFSNLIQGTYMVDGQTINRLRFPEYSNRASQSIVNLTAQASVPVSWSEFFTHLQNITSEFIIAAQNARPTIITVLNQQ